MNGGRRDALARHVGRDRDTYIGVEARLVGAHVVDGVAPAVPADVDQAPAREGGAGRGGGHGHERGRGRRRRGAGPRVGAVDRGQGEAHVVAGAALAGAREDEEGA